MTFRSVYNEEQGGFWPLKAPPKRKFTRKYKSPIYKRF